MGLCLGPRDHLLTEWPPIAVQGEGAILFRAECRGVIRVHPAEISTAFQLCEHVAIQGSAECGELPELVRPRYLALLSVAVGMLRFMTCPVSRYWKGESRHHWRPPAIRAAIRSWLLLSRASYPLTASRKYPLDQCHGTSYGHHDQTNYHAITVSVWPHLSVPCYSTSEGRGGRSARAALGRWIVKPGQSSLILAHPSITVNGGIDVILKGSDGSEGGTRG